MRWPRRRRREVIITQYCGDPRWFVKAGDAPPLSYTDWSMASEAICDLERWGYRVRVVPHVHVPKL